MHCPAHLLCLQISIGRLSSANLRPQQPKWHAGNAGFGDETLLSVRDQSRMSAYGAPFSGIAAQATAGPAQLQMASLTPRCPVRGPATAAPASRGTAAVPRLLCSSHRSCIAPPAPPACGLGRGSPGPVITMPHAVGPGFDRLSGSKSLLKILRASWCGANAGTLLAAQAGEADAEEGTPAQVSNERPPRELPKAG